MIHIYSLGYMKDERGRSRYFAALSLFMFSMLGIVLANNFVMMFIFWELVGVSSYILIGHWFNRASRSRRGATRHSSPTASATSGSCSAS